MNPGGESADTLVKMYLSGVEMMIRLSGSALKNMLALSMALAKEHKKVSGKINLTKMLRETRDLRTFTMTPAQYEAFKHLAKKHGILFAAVTDRDERGKLVDVILPATELDRANLLFERILYDPKLGPESPEPPRTKKEPWWKRIFRKLKEKLKKERKPAPERKSEEPLLEKGQDRELLREGYKAPLLREGYVPPLLEEGEPENPIQPVPEAALPEYRYELTLDTPVQYPEPVPVVIPAGLPVPEEEVRIEKAESPGEDTPGDGEAEKDREEAAGRDGRKETVVVLPPEPRIYAGPPRESGGVQPEPIRGDAPPSRAALPGTNSESRVRSRKVSQMTSERPSVLKRLEAFRAQTERTDLPAPEKNRNTEKGAVEKAAGSGRHTAGRDSVKPDLPPRGVKPRRNPMR